MSEQQIQKVKVQRLLQVGLWSVDVAAQARFYRRTLGLGVQSVFESTLEEDGAGEHGHILLALDDEYPCLALFDDTRSEAAHGRVPLQNTRLHHLAFEVKTDAELAALAARLSMAGVELSLAMREDDPEMHTLLHFADPDGNQIEISAASEHIASGVALSGGGSQFRPQALEHVALQTLHLELMVDFYADILGFDISDWLLRECAWLRCNSDHHTLALIQGPKDIDHIGFAVQSGSQLLHWADHLSRRQAPILWGPGRHGAGNNLFLRFADAEGTHIELSAELQQYYDADVTTPPRLWHARAAALNLWGALPTWMREESKAY